MNRFAIIENGVVTNVVASDPEFAAQNNWIECPDAQIGWVYDGNSFSQPPRDLDSEWAQVRMTRDALLVASDVSVLPDRWAVMTAEKQSEWSTYRQALRDIPTNFSDPAEVVWPTKPE